MLIKSLLKTLKHINLFLFHFIYLTTYVSQMILFSLVLTLFLFLSKQLRQLTVEELSLFDITFLFADLLRLLEVDSIVSHLDTLCLALYRLSL